MLKLKDISKGEEVRLFSSIAIEIASKCNRTCHFCPNGYNDQPDVYMETNLIEKVLLELKELKYKGRVEWYIYNEPTRDKRLVDIIALCRKILPSSCQMINTNGDYFKTTKDIQDIFDAGCNQMQINIYSSADKYGAGLKFEKGIISSQKRMDSIKKMTSNLVGVVEGLSLYQNIGPRKKTFKVINKFGITPNTKDNEVKGENHFSNRSGNIPDFRESVQEPLKKHCTRPFRFLNINYKGDAILCCNDYHGETNFGNIRTQNIKDIWNDASWAIYRLKLQNKDRHCYLCHNCDFNGGYYPHMIDNVTLGEEEDINVNSCFF